MNERLREINRSLQILDDAHRLGRISREDYRRRRRQLLSPLCDSGGITARSATDAVTVPQRETATRPSSRPADEAVSALFPRRKHWLPWGHRSDRKR